MVLGFDTPGHTAYPYSGVRVFPMGSIYVYLYDNCTTLFSGLWVMSVTHLLSSLGLGSMTRSLTTAAAAAAALLSELWAAQPAWPGHQQQ